MTDQELDFTIERLGECRFPSPMRKGAVHRRRGADPLPLPVRRHQTLHRCGNRAAVAGAGRAAGADILRSGGHRLRHRHLRRPLPGDQRRDPRRGLEPLSPLRCRQDLRFPLRLRGAGEAPSATPRSISPPRRWTASASWGGRSSPLPGGPRTRPRWSTTLEELGIGILFAIGGDGTLKGAARDRHGGSAPAGAPISVIGIPKTIDNDISFVQTTFGFETAVAEAQRAIYAAHTEAVGARNGIGLVKLMGRDSGFIAAFSALVDSQVNFCLVPEVPFTLAGFLRRP